MNPLIPLLLAACVLPGTRESCVHYEGDCCLTPDVPPWSEHCPQAPLLEKMAEESIDQCSTVYIIETWANGLYRKSVACADKTCPTENCNDVMRVRTTGTYPNDDTYPAKIDDQRRTTGQLNIELVPIDEQ